MKIYRVTITTEILVHCEDEMSAERIGYKNLIEEVKNGSSTSTYKIEEIKKIDELRRAERGSLPWRDSNRFGETELRVEEILGS